MLARNFLKQTTQILAEYFEDHTSKDSELPPLRCERELTDLLNLQQESTHRGGGFFGVTKNVRTNVFLIPHNICRAQANRTNDRRTRYVQRDGKSLAVSVAAPEAYRIHYVVMGPSIATELGQEIAAAFISIVMDTRSIPLNLVDSEESIKLNEKPLSSDDYSSIAKRLETNRSPLFSFEAEVMVETGNPLATDQRVHYPPRINAGPRWR